MNSFLHEDRIVQAGAIRVAGVDEAGMGPLAGPVAAAAVVVKERKFEEKIDDSKKLTEKRRQRAYLEIQKKCDVGIGLASIEEIDQFNIYQAGMMAMERAVGDLLPKPDYLLIDGKDKNVKLSIARDFLIRGDATSFSIACASIVAKVFRDTIMLQLHKKYPLYGFDKHKGYGTRMHLENIKTFGVCQAHRRSFKPCMEADQTIKKEH